MMRPNTVFGCILPFLYGSLCYGRSTGSCREMVVHVKPCTLCHSVQEFMGPSLGTPSAMNRRPRRLGGLARGPQRRFTTAFPYRKVQQGKAVRDRQRNPDGPNAVHRGLQCGSDWTEYFERRSEPHWNDWPVYTPTAVIVIRRSDRKPTVSAGKPPTAVGKLLTSGRRLSD